MNKGQGFAVGGALAVALLFRLGGSSTSQEPETSPAGQGITNPSAPTSRVGPWIASCKYWAPARDSEDPPSKKPTENHAMLAIKDGEIELRARLGETNEQKELACGSDGLPRWGFPAAEAGPIHITAIIATVPDPVHTHLALTFDRTVDSILQAATDNNWVSSYYWLPWKNHGGVLRFTEAPGDAEQGHDPERERQPGLLILKPGSGDPPGSFDNVIYLFLVAETPTLGIDGFQLQRALQYEAELKSALGEQFSTGVNRGVTIIGPQFSGSAVSLRASIETAQRKGGFANAQFEVTGATSTPLPGTQLEKPSPKIDFVSLADNRGLDIQTLDERLALSGSDTSLVLLSEDNTAAARSTLEDQADYSQKNKRAPDPVIRFPREISLLRNAQSAGGQSGGAAFPSGVTFSPYLHFSLKDYSAQDGIPQFSRDNTPLSQEAQLMAIARQVQQFRFRYIAIAGSNVLDEIFVAQFLHRACPDARLVFFGADLLMVREIDNIPFIGSITVTPYPLIGLRSAGRAYTDSTSEAYYNAVAYTLWHTRPQGASVKPFLQGYRGVRREDNKQPPMWATAIGRDGYYPLAILSPSASSNPHILPPIESGVPRSTATIYPSQLWVVLCVFVGLLCLAHTAMLSAADYWSPLTRDLAIQANDQPRRRSAYINVATAMLFCMAFVISCPAWWLWLSGIVHINTLSKALSLAALLSGLLAVVVSLLATRKHLGWVDRPAEPSAYGRVRANVYLFFNLGVLLTLVGVPCLWFYLCGAGSSLDADSGGSDFLGLCFSYRSIHPGSGVSPVVPVLLLLFSWYLWAVFQTLRLRFSDNGKPRLPEKPKDKGDARFFVSEYDVERCETSRHYCLYRNITCLLILRDVIRRFFGSRPVAGPCGAADDGVAPGRSHRLAIDIVLGVVYASLLVRLSLFAPIQSVDHFLWNTGRYLSCPYEFLVAGLFFPLIAMSLTGWLRMILIWISLNRGVLGRLENMPIRFAFNRLKVVGWMAMLRTGGLQEQWRDMARGLESMRQMLHRRDLLETSSVADRKRLEDASKRLEQAVEQVGSRYHKPVDNPPPGERDYDLMKEVELGFAAFSQELLSILLIPYWNNARSGLVQSQETETGEPALPQPVIISMAEEFVAIRYLSLIQCVLANLRYLMIFVSTAFVLTIWAWNSYPFQPSQLGDLLFTGLLAVLGSGVVWVFAQMHRNAILSRITETRPNELGWDFYLRIFSFGALPVLTWLAYQFPDFGNLIYKFLQPGSPVIK